METEERGIADDGDDDEGWQVAGVGQVSSLPGNVAPQDFDLHRRTRPRRV